MTFLYKRLRSLKYNNIYCFKALIYIRQRTSGHLFSAGKNGVILNCGGPRTGSTLLNMILKEILQVKLSSENNYVESTSEFSSRLSAYSHFSLIKTHRYFSNIQALINSGQVIAFMTHRDIRDVTVSLCQKGWVSDISQFIESKDLKQIAYSSIAYANIDGMNILSYQQLMEELGQSIAYVADKLGIKLSESQVDEIKRTVSKDNVSRKIDQISHVGHNDLELDEATGLHKDHIKDGKSGKWRDILTADEARTIADECREYMAIFGYEHE